MRFRPRRPNRFSAREHALSYNDELIEAFQKARQLKDQINRLDQIVKNAGIFQKDEDRGTASGRSSRRKKRVSIVTGACNPAQASGGL